jgi:L-alanine-DL-glutamate epimerase-like enolase superfamily enzyme
VIVERIEVIVTELPVRLKRIFSSGSYDTGPPDQLLGKPVFVKLYADGVTGCAQIRPISPGHFVADTTQSVVAAITEIYGPNLLGRRIFDMETITEMFDLRLAGNPAARTMIAEARRAVDEFGIKVLCLKAAGKDGWRQDVKNFAAVRRAVGDQIMIGIDPNTGWSVADTIAAMRGMRDFDVGYVEQPVGRRDFEGLAEVRREASGVPIMADESLFTLEDAIDLVRHRSVDVFCIKLYKVGGLSPARKMSAVGRSAGILMNCGGLATTSTFEAAAAAHFCASVPARQTFGAAEFVFGLGPLGRDPLAAESPMRIEDGAVRVPTGPGLGIALDETALQKMTLHKAVVAR